MHHTKELLGHREETLRLMGYGGHAPDAQVSLLLDEVIEALRDAARFRYVCLRCGITIRRVTVQFGAMRFESRDLAAHLQGCGEGYMFAATLGAGPDRLLSRYERTHISRANALQAAAAALLELRADDVHARLAGDHPGCELTRRFSPGYGDLSLASQERFIEVLDAGRHIGLSCTAHAMLTPTKSITALIGVREGGGSAETDQCAACTKADCAYRRCKL